MFKRGLIVILIIGLFVGCFREAPSNATANENTVNNNKEESNIPSFLMRPMEQWEVAPDFTTSRVGGGEFKLSSLKGKVVLLNFWGVACGFCKMQIPDFVEFYKKYKDEGLEIVGISTDRESTIKNYAKSMHMDYILVLANQEVIHNYREIRGIPTTFVIDRQGDIVEKHLGYTAKSEFEKEIKELLKQNK